MNRFDTARELHLDRLRKAAAVLKVVPVESGRIDVRTNPVIALAGNALVAAIVIEPGMPEEGLLVRADRLTIGRLDHHLDFQPRNEAAIGGIAAAGWAPD